MRYLFISLTILFIFSSQGKGNTTSRMEYIEDPTSEKTEEEEEKELEEKRENWQFQIYVESPLSPSAVLKYIPEGYSLFEELSGDLNKDGLDDYILIVKGTDKEFIERSQWGEIVDRNHRGIIVVLNKGNHYEKVVDNPTCFLSEVEDGGVYFAPELSIEIQRNTLKINYLHGRYGSWGYTFRYQNNTFEKIGYDSYSSRGPIGLEKVSINYSTNKQKTSTNVNADLDEDADEKWVDKWDKIEVQPLDDLNKIEGLY